MSHSKLFIFVLLFYFLKLNFHFSLEKLQHHITCAHENNVEYVV